MTPALAIARFALAPALLLLAAWFLALRRARPDLLTRWLAAKVVVLLAGIALAAVASALGTPSVAVICIGLADVVAWFLAARLWIERRPRALSVEAATREAERLAYAAMDIADAARREAERRDGH